MPHVEWIPSVGVGQPFPPFAPPPPASLPIPLLAQYGSIFPSNFGAAFGVAQQVANAGFGPFAQQIITMATGQGAVPPRGTCTNFPGAGEILTRFPGSTGTDVVSRAAEIIAGTDITAITALITQLTNMGGTPTAVAFANRRVQALQSGDTQAANRVVQEMCLPTSALVEPPPGPPGPAPPVPTEVPPGPPAPPEPAPPAPGPPQEPPPTKKKKSSAVPLIAGALLLGIAVIAIGSGG